MKIDRRGFLGALGLGALAAKLSGGTTAAAPASPEPSYFVDEQPREVRVRAVTGDRDGYAVVRLPGFGLFRLKVDGPVNVGDLIPVGFSDA